MMAETLEIYNRLIRVLEEQVKVYRAMLDLVRREKTVLVDAKIEPLNELNKSKEAMVTKLKTLDRTREKVARDLGFKMGLVTESPRLIELSEKLDLPYSTRLRSIHSTLELLVKRISELNKVNEELVKATLKTINGALDAVKDTIEPRKTYAPGGEIKKNEVSGAFVSKEV